MQLSAVLKQNRK